MRSFKKIAAMVMAVAMLCSFTALAAEVNLADVADTTSATPTVTLNYTSDAVQNTILVYAGTSVSNADVVYINQLGQGAAADGIDVTIPNNAPVDSTYTVMVGGSEVATAATDTFFYADSTPKYDVTVTPATLGNISASVDSLVNIRENTEVVFTFAPNLGYEINNITVNDILTPITDNKYTLTVTENTTITANFTAIDTSADGSYTYDRIIDVAAGEAVENAEKDLPSKLVFAKAVGTDIVEMGMYLQKETAEGYVDFVTTGEQQYGPYFAAAKWTVDRQYGIRFYAFSAGNYKMQSYTKHADGTYTYGNAIEFTVE